MLTRMVQALLAAIILAGAATPALAQWGPDPYRGPYYRGPYYRDPYYRAPYPYHHGPYYGPPPRHWESRGEVEMLMVYPPPPPPGPQVVYVPSAPIQAAPASDPFTDQQGRYCREYQSMIMVNGQPQPSYGTACRMPDGQWRIVQ